MIRGWKMTGPGTLTAFEEKAKDPSAGRVLVKVAGCGVCHTDLGYLYGGVPTKQKLPLVLGHEISGVVLAAGAGGEAWLGRRVLVPAVSSCGSCRWCKGGRPTACRASKMPGNDEDGGFASHVEVPAATLCAVDGGGAKVAEDAPIGKEGLGLWELSVVADAVSTPVQAIKRCGLAKGDLAVVIGCGGVGTYAVQIARAAGAHVAAIDIDPAKLERAKQFGAALTVDAKTPFKELRGALQAFAKSAGVPADGWRILETSGSKPGQELGWGLLTPGGSISIVGFTTEASQVKLSNLMAFDATAYGNWGCDPALYPYALELVTSGAVRVRGLIRKERMADAPQVIDAVHHGKIAERVVLVP
ncbi:MAG: 6-hydroxycyclohex-1-ene-1-carbonyl-CoA dehydrogenase [Myxococcaceae bacterium]